MYKQLLHQWSPTYADPRSPITPKFRLREVKGQSRKKILCSSKLDSQAENAVVIDGIMLLDMLIHFTASNFVIHIQNNSL